MISHAPPDYVCPFCLLVKDIANEHVHSRHSDIIYQDKAVTAFVAAKQWPQNFGNVLIMPNAHFENIYTLPIHLATQIHRVARIVALALKAAYGCDGVSTRQHNEPAGSQDVWHYHLHVTPRYHGDNFYRTMAASGKWVSIAERVEPAAKLRTILNESRSRS